MVGMKNPSRFKDREQTSIKGFNDWLQLQKNLGNLEFERCNTGAVKVEYTVKKGKDKGKKKHYFYKYGLFGASDFIVFLHGARCLFIEFKTEKGKQEDSQIKFQQRIERLKFRYRIFNNSGDAIDFVRYWMEL